MFGVTQEQPPSNTPSTTTPTAEEEALKRNTDCVYFLASPLTCKKGSECEFRHSDVARVNPRDCWYWLNGNCLNPKCAFRHPPLDGLLGTQVPIPLGNSLPPSQVILELSAPYVSGKQAVPCIYFQRGNCLKGDVCPFLHGIYPASNKVAQVATAAPVTESQPKKTFGVLGKSSQEPKVSQINTPKPVNLLHPKHVTTIENNQLRNGVVMKKNVSLSTSLDEEIARHRPTNVHSESNENPSSRLNRNHQGHVLDDQSILNSKDTEDFSREPSPGFDVLVDDKRRDSEYYPREDQFRRSIGHEGRNVNPINDYEIGRSDYTSEVDQVMYRESRGYESYGHYGQEERRVSSSVSAHPERRGYPRTDSSDQMDEVDLRHHLSKQKKRGNGLSSVTHDYFRGSRVEDQKYLTSRRDHLPAQESSLSSRLRGRIKVPGRSTSPVRHHGRLSPDRPQGRLRDRIKEREQEDINSEKNFRGPGIRDRDDNNAEFTGPKRLAELRIVKKSDGYEQPMTERMSLGKRKFPKLEGAPQQVDGDVSFKGPMPLSEILKRKRGGEVASNESGMTSANNENDGNESSMIPIENKETKGTFLSVSSDVVNHVDKEESKLAASDVGEVDEKSTQGHSSLQLETEEGMIGDEAIEGQGAEGYNQREGEYDYELADDEEYNLDEGENADLDEEYYEEEEEEDADDFAKKMGVIYS